MSMMTNMAFLVDGKMYRHPGCGKVFTARGAANNSCRYRDTRSHGISSFKRRLRVAASVGPDYENECLQQFFGSRLQDTAILLCKCVIV
jgi:hypothetical protein